VNDGYIFGQYKRLTNRFSGALTGKGLEFGGSPIRKEATGYGVVYMMEDMLSHRGRIVVTMSDSSGFVIGLLKICVSVIRLIERQLCCLAARIRRAKRTTS
jgi:glutamate dehydrogenase/leucine dehydrogenase